MRERTDINPLSITDGKISNQAKISPSKLAPGSAAQVMIAQADGKYAPKTISGDGTLAIDGTLTVTTAPVTTTETYEADSVKVGTTDGGTSFVKVSGAGGPGTIPVRDSDGLLDAEKLGGKTVDEIVSGSAQVDGRKLTSTITGGTQTEQVKSNKVVTYSEDTSGYGSDPAPKKEFTVDHNLGVEPNVMVYVKEGSDYKEADAEVISTISQTTVKLSAYGQKVKFKISP
tara:strand:+ start:651 stop:1337 length:687 start_codon:yes stop_codon:yes gene_type:complete